MGKVVEPLFPIRCTYGEDEPVKVLDDAKRAKLEMACVLGITEAGEAYFAYSDGWAGPPEIYYWLHKAALAVMEGDAD